jgi:hypothetical protein
MSVKLRQLAQMDPEYAKMLKDLFEKRGVCEADYLDMTVDDFIELLTITTEKMAKIVNEALKKHEHKL